MKILIATPEAAPFAKTGGLADVAGALLKEFRHRGEDVSLILPLYAGIRERFRLHRTGKSFTLSMGEQSLTGEIWTSDGSSNPRACFIDCEPLYGRPELYGTAGGDYPDNARRFSFFSRGVLETCLAMNIRPDVLHCNEWQTALIPLYLRKYYSGEGALKKTAVLYTVHNLGYQGIFPASDLGYTGLGWDSFTPEGIEFYGKLNFMKAGLVYSDLINTVSETYAREILEEEYGFGLEGVLRKRSGDLYGVINGIDYEEWDPGHDPFIPAGYSAGNLRGKGRCKRALLSAAGLSGDKSPLFGIVSRLSFQKGLDLVSEAVDGIVSLGANVAVLGKGDEHYQELFAGIAEKYRGRVSVKVGFDEPTAHLIYAAADFFLMPSRYEPCGLGQLIAMRYGTIPVVRRTGGLADTVKDYNPADSSGTGFLFPDYSSASLLEAVERAVALYADRKRMRRTITEVFGADFSWRRASGRYLELYRKAVEKVRG